jgi:hypothetical protein
MQGKLVVRRELYGDANQWRWVIELIRGDALCRFYYAGWTSPFPYSTSIVNVLPFNTRREALVKRAELLLKGLHEG